MSKYPVLRAVIAALPMPTQEAILREMAPVASPHLHPPRVIDHNYQGDDMASGDMARLEREVRGDVVEDAGSEEEPRSTLAEEPEEELTEEAEEEPEEPPPPRKAVARKVTPGREEAMNGPRDPAEVFLTEQQQAVCRAIDAHWLIDIPARVRALDVALARPGITQAERQALIAARLLAVSMFSVLAEAARRQMAAFPTPRLM